MRLIDADALHEALNTKQKWVVRCGDKHNEGYTYDQVHFAIEEAVERFKEKYEITDRPQGMWFKDDEDTFICSACGSGYKDQPTIMGKPMFEWCPICGARMKGVDDEVR